MTAIGTTMSAQTRARCSITAHQLKADREARPTRIRERARRAAHHKMRLKRRIGAKVLRDVSVVRGAGVNRNVRRGTNADDGASLGEPSTFSIGKASAVVTEHEDERVDIDEDEAT